MDDSVNYEMIQDRLSELLDTLIFDILWLLPMTDLVKTTLKSLTIDGRDHLIDECAIKQILCGSPNLEQLSMLIMENYENLSVQSTSLRELVIEKPMDHCLLYNLSTDTELRIWTPNLETLNIGGVPYSECLLMDVSLLTRVNLWFSRPPYNVDNLFCWNGFLGKTLSQILPTIQHVEWVELSDWCIKVIRVMKNK
ncbi:hypothetical protein C2S53_013358 [Perilla frutescens var. hirtella]|uniref:Uncharacterized protein n=1 Tax=Perilla frutescens var. hirtella TaxID=608512 RepID=A0AAD4PCC3_PERFH|nr:hypothetical protein C2S53_013358 [Perilla frutescens var. hirtella]